MGGGAFGLGVGFRERGGGGGYVRGSGVCSSDGIDVAG